ncbi:TetR/AcrR family transcriptional regulator [Bacillus sp. FJAT-22090]|uniref:TetR/AcrR family transcriptional regulator n=1 Tax=Bacillus sp. FJAT-22090 TaxID=1581038 RepID=UPI0011A1538C|nr:TetR/AcrR family transcriptional regulator [Bacillus sp. FJAT-22090]
MTILGLFDSIVNSNDVGMGAVHVKPQSRWEQERKEGKNKRMKSIIETAGKVFSRKGFEKTTMQDIADEENIGIATVFRYFPKKDNLIIAVAVNILEGYLSVFQSVASMNGTCLEKVEKLFDHFISDVEPENLEYTQLLEAFESYASTSLGELGNYQDYIEVRKKIVDVLSIIVEEGMQDGSIRSDNSIKDVLAAVINAFGLFSRKLSLFKRIPFLNDDLAPSDQLAIIKKIFMDYIRAR